MADQWPGRHLLRPSFVALLTVAFAGLPLTSLKARDLDSVGVLVGDLGNPFFVQIGKGVEDAAVRLVGRRVSVTVRSSGYDLQRQIAQIDEFIKSGTDMLVLNAVDTDKIGPAVQRARDAGIIVVAIDVKAAGAQATVTSDNRKAGTLACKFLAESLGGRGDVLILNGPPVSSVVERVRGCRSALSAHPKLRVLPDDEDCGGSLDGGLACMTGMLAKYAHLDAVFAINDPTAIGADIAADRAGRREFFVVAVDGSPLAADVLKSNGTRVAATVTQHPGLMAERAVQIGLELFEGRLPREDTVEMPVSLMTVENVGGYVGWDR